MTAAALAAGEWQLDAAAGCLVHPRSDYDISLAQLATGAACARWVAHVAEKAWATEQTVADLLDAIARWA